MIIAIIGTGGVGGYIGGRIAATGFNVSFIARGEHLNALKTNGLTVKSVSGDFKLDRIKVTDNISDLGPVDLILICLKAWQVRDVACELKSVVKENTVVLPLQNGVSTIDELNKHVTKSNIIGGLCRIISRIESPGVINHSGIEPSIVFGEIDKRKTERILAIKELFDYSGIDSAISNDITADIWRKFIGICVSGLLAVTKSTYGEIRELKQTRRMMIDLLTEVYKLAIAMGINIESNFVDKTVSQIDSYPYDSTSSLTRDVWEGKKSEIDYQNGAVIKLAKKFGIDTPINKFVYNCILPMELKARKQIPARIISTDAVA
jgi:2-dehydropantoate 2-reductase